MTMLDESLKWHGRRVLGLLVLSAVAGLSPIALGALPRALPEGQLPNDVRLQPLKDLDGYFPFTPPGSPEAWTPRAERVRRQILVSQGLWPMPGRTPLNAVVRGRIDRGDYTVEKVYFESAPGFFVTGNLYRPKGRSGPCPAVLSPHGHWADGRFHDAGVANVRKEIVEGAERFEEGGRSPLQARCVQLARMGCVVFHYDMIGYADSVQIPQSLAHGFSKQRPEMNRSEGWGLFSPQAEAHGQSVMGLQTWNSLRALDFLLSLPEVDAGRVGVTGASGGGTQTFLLCAIDERPTVAFPAVMVSTAMQGGCTCENACDLRINTGNVEFAALFAPKPLGLTSANDWTREMATKGFPELKQHYTMLGAPESVSLKRGEHFGHNYNYVSRAAMYAWFNRHFRLGLPEPVVEEDYQRLTREQMTVWDDQHPRPEGGPDFERRLLRWWTEETARQLNASLSSPDTFRRVVGGAIEVVLGRTLAGTGPVAWQPCAETARGAYREVVGLLRHVPAGEELPTVILTPRTAGPRTVVWIDPLGKDGLYESASSGQGGTLRPEIRRLLDAGVEVIGVDLLYQGEFLADGQAITQTRRVKNPREAAAYTFGYNHSLFAQRVHDVLMVLRFARERRNAARLDLVGLGGAGPWVAAARAVAANAVDRLALDTGGFRFANLTEIHDVNFLPGGAKYFDLPGLLALGAPGRVWVAGEGPELPKVIVTAYELAGARDQVVAAASGAGTMDAAVQWLLQGD